MKHYLGRFFKVPKHNKKISDFDNDTIKKYEYNDNIPNTIRIDELKDDEVDHIIFIKYNIIHCIVAQSNELQFFDNGEELTAGFRANGDFVHLPDPPRYMNIEVNSFISTILEEFPTSNFFDEAYGHFNIMIRNHVISCIVYFINREDSRTISLKLIYGNSAMDTSRKILSEYADK